MMLQFSFVFVWRHFVPMVPPVVITINKHAYFVSGWPLKEAERDDHFRTAPTENSGPKFKIRLLRSLVNLLPFRISNQKE